MIQLRLGEYVSLIEYKAEPGFFFNNLICSEQCNLFILVIFTNSIVYHCAFRKC